MMRVKKTAGLLTAMAVGLMTVVACGDDDATTATSAASTSGDDVNTVQHRQPRTTALARPRSTTR